ncbi:MAG: glycosyltransferase family 39 protein [Chloroflexota bacterium]
MRTPLALYALALVVRLLLLAGFPDPAYPDSFYYVDVARSLAAGHGFSVDVVWVFAEVGGAIPANPVLPIPSNAHWMPLASLVQVPFIWLLGPTALASALPFALAGSLAAPLTWALARDAGASRLVAVGAGVLVAIPAASTVFMAQPDNFGLYQPLVAAALWMGARGLRGSGRAFALGGLLVGLATLARNDGVLVGAALGLAFVWDRWRAWRSGGRRRPAIPPWAAVACLALFLAVVAPWLARQLAVFGSISPSSASGKVLLIRSIEEWNSITTPASLDWLLSQGLGPLVSSRIGGLVAAITIFAVLVGGALLAPFMVVGGWTRRRSRDFGPFFAYAGLLFAFSAIVSAVHVPGGTFIHSVVGLAPHAYVLALQGIAVAVGWVAARRSTWSAPAATRFFSVAAVGFAVVGAIWSALVTQAAWASRRDDFLLVDRGLANASAAPDDRVMSIDALGTLYWTGHPGVVLVDDPLATIEDVARAYDIRWLVLVRAETVGAVAPILNGEPRPAWLGPPVASRPARPLPDAAPLPAGAVGVALYPVCLDAADARCAEVAP